MHDVAGDTPAELSADIAADRARQLAAEGRYEPALTAATDAVADYRTLAADQPEVFGPDLAATLGIVAECAGLLGRHGEAVEAARQSVALFREFTESADDPDAAAFRPYLAAGLASLAGRLDEGGDLAEAIGIGREAVAAYQQLAATEPIDYLPPLAQALNNLAVRQRTAGQRAPAIATTRQAVNIYRRLASTDPENYADYLAITLGNLANMLDDTGRDRDALTVTKEIVELYRSLAARAPDEAAPDAGPIPVSAGSRYDAALAGWLNNLAVRLSAAGDGPGALAATEESAGLLRRLARRDPPAHLGNLAGVLSNLAADLAGAGRDEEALVTARESVDACRRLVFRNRGVYLPQLAQAVNNLAVRLHEAGRTASAMANAREAGQLYAELAGRDPELYRDAVIRVGALATELRGG